MWFFWAVLLLGFAWILHRYIKEVSTGGEGWEENSEEEDEEDEEEEEEF